MHRLLQEVPNVLDWSSKVILSSVKSQGYCGASEAFATAAFYEAEAIISLNKSSVIDLSEQFLITCNPRNTNCTNRASVP
jgi:hypothetical protein